MNALALVVALLAAAAATARDSHPNRNGRTMERFTQVVPAPKAPKAPIAPKAPTAPQTPTATSPGCTCSEDADYTLARYEETVTATTRTINTMGIPNHPMRVGRQHAQPGVACFQPSTLSLPAQPGRSGSYTSTPMGVIGVLKTGAFVYNHLSNVVGVDDIAKAVEGVSLDQCHGHHDQSCTYHYHEISKLAACTHDGVWNDCELIGYLNDGFPIYSHCYNHATSRYLKSCYSITADTDNDKKDTSDYTHSLTSDCDLDQASGYDFTGKNLTDSTGNTITGYAYVATDTYPYVMPYYAGSTWAKRSTWVMSPTSPVAAPVASPVVVVPMATPGASPVVVAPIAAPTSAPKATPAVSPVTTAPKVAKTAAPVLPVASPAPKATIATSKAPVKSPIISTATPTSAPKKEESRSGRFGTIFRFLRNFWAKIFGRNRTDTAHL